MNADGTGTVRLTDTDQEDEQPSWSADGKRIAFSREGAIFEAPATGGPAHRVGHGLGNAGDPAFSPDGKLIAYDYRNPGYSIREIYVMNADGTGIRKLTSSVPSALSPPGRPTAGRWPSRAMRAAGKYEIYTVDLNGGRSRAVTTSQIDAIQPAWTPDGTGVAFVAGRGDLDRSRPARRSS